MSSKSEAPKESSTPNDDAAGVDRRRFLTGLGLGGLAAGLAALPQSATAQTAAPALAASGSPPAPGTSLAAESEFTPELSDYIFRKSGSDFMVDVVRTLGIDFIAANPGSTFRGLQESFINYGRNTKPEWLTCTHEEASVAMAHGYAKIAGKPMACALHGTVGIMHGSMALYNAFADRVPIICFSAATNDAATRRPGVEWEHSVQDNAAMVRDYTKWDDQPWSLQHFAESTVHAYRIATAVPMGPVLITADGDLQENELKPEEEKKLQIPKLSLARPPSGDSAALKEVATLLVNAENPVIIADRYARTQNGMQMLVELAELVQAPVIDTGNRMNFPNNHVLAQAGRRGALIQQADFILALEAVDLWGMTHTLRDVIGRPSRSNIKPATKVASISSHDLLIKANYQEGQRYAPSDIAISADAEASMPGLIEAVKSVLNDSRKTALKARGQKLADSYKTMVDGVLKTAASGFDLSPVAPSRLVAELWPLIKNEDWSLVGNGNGWAKQLWTMDKPYRHTGGSGAAGVGYGAPAAVGAALANKQAGRLSINIQPDGDLMYSPGVLWTSAHHKIPMLWVMFNNRGYHQEVMHLQRMANRHNRDPERAEIGTTLIEPNLDYAKIAQGMGMYASGPISDPKDLRGALMAALDVVKRGEPALVDVVSQPR
jgi:acetolactate synthase-1/2/3 large subunit